MNKTETVNAISQTTGIDIIKCIRIVDSLEFVLTHQLEKTGGIRNFFDRIYLLLDCLKTEQDCNTQKEAADLIAKVAHNSETSVDETKNVLTALVGLLNDKIETSWSARVKFKTATKLVDFFRHK